MVRLGQLGLRTNHHGLGEAQTTPYLQLFWWLLAVIQESRAKARIPSGCTAEALGCINAGTAFSREMETWHEALATGAPAGSGMDWGC